MAAMASLDVRAPVPRAASRPVVARASAEPATPCTRRGALSLLSIVAGSLLATQQAEAKLGNGSSASQSGYGPTGPKKNSITPDKRQQILAKLKPQDKKNQAGLGSGKNPIATGQK